MDWLAKLVAKWFFENEENLVKKDLRRYSIKISYSLGEKIQFPLSIELLHKEKDFLEAENRVNGASSSRKTVHSLVKRSKNSRNLKFNLRKGCPEIQFSLKNVTIQKKKKKRNRSDRYSKNLIGKRCFVKRDAVQREISFRGVPDFRAKCVFCGTKVFLEITVCRWKSSRGFGNTVTCWASR